MKGSRAPLAGPFTDLSRARRTVVLQEIAAAFKKLDQNNSGDLSLSELKAVVQFFGGEAVDEAGVCTAGVNRAGCVDTARRTHVRRGPPVAAVS